MQPRMTLSPIFLALFLLPSPESWYGGLVGSSADDGSATFRDPTFQFRTDSDGVVITATAEPGLLEQQPFVELDTEDMSDSGFCIPLSVAPPASNASGGGELAVLSTAPERLPLNNYCARIACPCGSNMWCTLRPRYCAKYHKVGDDLRAWKNDTRVYAERIGDAADGPAVSVVVRQGKLRFPRLLIEHDGCPPDTKIARQGAPDRKITRREVPADEPYFLHEDCTLTDNRNITVWVEPGTRFCNFSPNCRNVKVTIDARALGRRPPPTPPLSVRSAGPSTLLTVGLPLLALATLLAVAAGLLFLRRKHRRALRGFMATSQENGGFGLELSGPRVLLLHLARSDAERAALRQLTAELRLRGASVVDSDAPEWRRAARRDAAALASAVAAADRVLLLSSPALAAAVAAGGGGEPERLVAAAARQLSAGRLTVDYGRLYQARLAADAPTLDSLVPGAAYTLPEHQRELVTALLADTNRTKGAAADAVLPADITVAELTV